MDKFDWEIGLKKLPNHKTVWDQLLQCFKSCKTKKTSSADSTKPTTLHKTNTESDFFLYELASQSEILYGADTSSLGKHLPSRAVGFPWKLIYSTTVSGFSLSSLYRKMVGIDLPVLLVIKDMKDRVFGAVLTCGLRVEENFYGNHDTFVFRCHPHFEAYKWSGNNFYFIQGKEDFVSIGAENGRFGLWLDDNLDKGRTEPCSTFSSPSLVEEMDFRIRTVECWTVIHDC